MDKTLTVMILGHARKTTERNRNRYNVLQGPEEIDGSSGSVNLSQINNVPTVPVEHTDLFEDSCKDVIQLVSDDVFDPAKQAELCKWKNCDVF